MEHVTRFTMSARAVLTLAQEEAARLNHNDIGAGHLLVGLAREDQGLASKVLNDLGLTADRLRAAVEALTGRNEQMAGEHTLTDEARRVIERAVDESHARHRQYVGTEHLLLALSRDENGVAAAVLGSLDVTMDHVRGRLTDALGAIEQEEVRMESSEVPNSRFDKFTERARRVLTLAQEEATRFNHNYIGTEHLLLGLVRERNGVAAKVLAELGVELYRVRSAVEFIIGRGDRMIVGEVGLTPRAKKVIELAVDEARRLGHHYIGTEHLLLGLVREGEGIAAGVLESLGVNLEKVRTQTVQVLSQGTTQYTDTQEIPGAPPLGATQWNYLEVWVGAPGADGERYVERTIGPDALPFEPGATPIREALRLLGQQGWELAAIDRAPNQDSALYVFKRPL